MTEGRDGVVRQEDNDEQDESTALQSRNRKSMRLAIKMAENASMTLKGEADTTTFASHNKYFTLQSLSAKLLSRVDHLVNYVRTFFKASYSFFED